MPHVQLLKRIVQDGRFARPGEVIAVSPQRAAILVRRGIGKEVFTSPTKAAEKPSSVQVEAPDTQTPPTGSPTGHPILSSSLLPDRVRRKRRSTKRKAKSEQ